jgi:O-antigen/teichoic acid export membrane protein
VFTARLLPIAGNQLAGLVLGLVGIRLLSYLVPPEVNGVYQVYFLTLSQLGVLLTHPGIINHASRFWQREKAQSGAYARFLWQVSWSHSKVLVLLVAVVCTGLVYRQRQPLWAWMFPLLVISNLALALNAAASVAINAEERHWAVLALTVGGTAARTLLPIALVLVFGASFFSLSCGYALHGVVMMGWILFVFRWAWRSPTPAAATRARWQQELREYGRPFVWLGIGGWLLQFADRWVVALVFGDTQAGIFAMAIAVGAYFPSLLQAGLMQWFFPIAFREADRAQTAADWWRLARRCDRMTGCFLVSAMAGLYGLNLVGPYLVGTVIGPRYAPAMGMLVAAGMTMAAAQVNQFYYLLLQGRRNSSGMVKVMATVAAIKTIGSLAAAAISWPSFLTWLVVSPLVCGLMGRQMIRRMALPQPPA